MVTREQIDAWCQAPTEHAHLEFKEARGQFAMERLYEYCVAIANEGGGHLILGITDAKPRRVVGTSAIPNPTQVVQQVHSKVRFRIDVEVVDHPDGRVVAVVIPSRPSGSAYNLDGRYLMRAGESLVPMSEDRLRLIFSESSSGWLERTCREGMTAEQIVASLDLPKFFELLREQPPTSPVLTVERLVREGLVIPRGSGHDLTRLGGILLARDLTDFSDLRHKAPRVVTYGDPSKLDTRGDKTGVQGYAVGFRRLIRFVMAQLPQHEVIEGGLRHELPMLPEVIVRELVANALIHQDFDVTGASVLVEAYPDRIEISNPGSPVVEIDRFIDGHRSRNELLANLMRRMGVCEERGSGIDRVVHLAEERQLPAPEFRQNAQRTSVVFAGPTPFEEMDRTARVRACYQHAVLRWVANGFMTNRSLRDRFKLPASRGATVSQVISATLEARLIRTDDSIGSSFKLRRYVPYWAVPAI